MEEIIMNAIAEIAMAVIAATAAYVAAIAEIAMAVIAATAAYVAARISKTNKEEAAKQALNSLVENLVLSAEQLFSENSDKYNYVANVLREKGYNVTDDEIIALIESNVLKLKYSLSKKNSR